MIDVLRVSSSGQVLFLLRDFMNLCALSSNWEDVKFKFDPQIIHTDEGMVVTTDAWVWAICNLDDGLAHGLNDVILDALADYDEVYFRDGVA